MTKTRTSSEPRLGWLANIVVSLAIVTAVQAAEKTVWKPVGGAILKIDDRPAKIWNVYRAAKKDHLLLITLGRRYLLLDIREKEIYEVAPEKFERKDKELVWHESDRPEKPLSTSDWTIHDAGPARRIRARLTAEGRVLEVQIPIQPDLRPFY